MIIATILRKLEPVINHLLAEDPHILEQITQHQGRIVRIKVSDLALALDIVPSEQGLLLMEAQLGAADVTLVGASTALLALLNSSSPGKSRFKHLTLEGDFELALSLSRSFSQLEVDWESLLAKPIGRNAAHDVVRVSKKVFGLAQDVLQGLGLGVQHRLQSGWQICPHRSAVDDFCQEVDHLRLAVDRLEAHIANNKKKRGRE